MSEGEEKVKWYINKIKHTKDWEARPLLIKAAKKKGTCMLETLFKSDEDRIWFYREFISFLKELKDIVGIKADIIPSNAYVCVYVPLQLLYYIKEYWKYKDVGWVYALFTKTDTEYKNADLKWIEVHGGL